MVNVRVLHGFYMVNTRSQTMSLNNEIKEYFAELIKPLATSESIEKLLAQFEEKITQKLNIKIAEQSVKIEELESTLAIRENTIDLLLERVEAVEKRADDNEQYSRRSCLRIHNVAFDKTKNDQPEEVLKDCYSKMNLEYNDEEIDRVHRIGQSMKLEDGKEVKSLIVKFKSWNARKRFYQSRPKWKPGSKSPFVVTTDLTTRRYGLLKHARGIVEKMENIQYAFVDINCSLGLKSKTGKLYFFNSKSEFNDVLSKI